MSTLSAWSSCLRLISRRSAGQTFAIKRRRWLSDLAARVSNPLSRVQAYVSTSNDPYLNLSIEHFLLQKSPTDSVVLFLYTNRPCIVIGRNQNPWCEVNLGLLNGKAQSPIAGPIDLVRRRSGGGTVFHDEGNINWSVICPSASFTRDKHAEMVVRALRELGIDRARVNQRHDIVLDQGGRIADSMVDDTHSTCYESGSPAAPLPLKVSGSAYKLTRTRSLHHGTCLLSSPNLPIIPLYLHSPAKPFIQARGVESVSSPVGNIGIDHSGFVEGVCGQFFTAYNQGNMEPQRLGQECLDEDDIRTGHAEITTKDWIYGHTPQFTFSSHPDWIEPRGAPIQSTGLPASARITFTARHGSVSTADFSISSDPEVATAQSQRFLEQLRDTKVHRLNWTEVVEKSASGSSADEVRQTADWLNAMMPPCEGPGR